MNTLIPTNPTFNNDSQDATSTDCDAVNPAFGTTPDLNFSKLALSLRIFPATCISTPRAPLFIIILIVQLAARLIG